jgi:hypothetical protein
MFLSIFLFICLLLCPIAALVFCDVRLKQMNQKNIFLFGPLASPCVFILFFILSLMPFRDVGMDLIARLGFSFGWAVFCSYFFTLLFGLPMYLLCIQKKLTKLWHFNTAALIASFMLSLVLFLFGNNEFFYTVSLISFFSMCNSTFMHILFKINTKNCSTLNN